MKRIPGLAATWACMTLILAASTASWAARPEFDADRGGGRDGRSQFDAGRGHDARSSFDGDRGREHDGRGQVLDNRYNHGHYYPERGTYLYTLPPGYRAYNQGGDRFYFNGGVWYAPRAGGRFIVTRPPAGLFVSILPPFYTTVWLGGAPYYYADDVYYSWRPDLNGYIVADPPLGADSAPIAAPEPQPPEDFFMYPKNGQTVEQQSADRYECHSWAKGQTGFDPTAPGGGVPDNENATRRADYKRAMGACLEARGYSVK